MPAPLSLVPALSLEPSRFDLYAPIHKALRAMMADALLRIGRVDGRDRPSLDDALARLDELLTFCGQHIEHENQFIHAAIQARTPPDGGLQTECDHSEHHHNLAELRHRAQALRAASTGDSAAALMALYRALALFIADNLTHMHHEETVNNGLLWTRYSDAELIGLHDRLMQSIPPHEMAFALRWMLPSLTALERAAILIDLRAKVPPGAFDGVLQMAHDGLSACEWQQLCADLGLAPDGLAA